ncbi:MAG: 50S ribosomal protein L25 [Lentisphaerae bacterium ADurb.BinA184]|nr:MAG: 50S ribosomal protein L25 [Lentisphaerae bacterium ADurb.BinA184]
MSREQIVIDAEPRTGLGKGPAHRMRQAGRIPGVIYGHGHEALPLSVEALALTPYIHHSGLITLKIGGAGGEARTAVIKELQTDAIRGTIRHVDFQEVRADEIIRTTVPVEARGVPAGATQGGQLEQVMYELPVRCPANAVPELIQINVAEMQLGDARLVKDLALPEGTVADCDLNQIVVHVVLPKIAVEAEETAEAAPAEGEAAAEPEVISKGKKDEEGAEEEGKPEAKGKSKPEAKAKPEGKK